MKKYFLALGIIFFTGISFAAKINMSVDKTEISTDDVLEISLSVDGVLDNGQIGIQGLENFNIVGQSSSQQIQVINGKTTAIQEKILNIQPKKSGDFTIQALGKENGKIIKSSEFKIKVKKSLAQETKEKLLDSSNVDDEQENSENTAKKSDNQDNIKDLLLQPSQQASQTEKLQPPKLPNIPPVQHFSAFNKIFWLELLGLIALLGLIFRGILFFKEKVYNK